MWNLLFLLLAVFGAVIAFRTAKAAFWVFVVTVATYTLVVSAGPEAYARFRAPLVPLLALLAAVVAQRCLRSLSLRFGKQQA